MFLWKKLTLFIVCLFTLFAHNACLATEWSKTYIQIGRGKQYKLGEPFRTIVKAIHSSSWRFGENYFYVDYANVGRDNTVVYGEIDPALSLSKILNRKVGGKLILDTLISSQFYFDEQGNREFSYGLTTYLDIHQMFKYFLARVHYRKYMQVPGNTYAIQMATQINLGYWRFLGNNTFLTGFLDWVPNNQGDPFSNTFPIGISKNLQLKAQLFFDVGQLFRAPQKIYFGPSASYWENKLGVRGQRERVYALNLRIEL